MEVTVLAPKPLQELALHGDRLRVTGPVLSTESQTTLLLKSDSDALKVRDTRSRRRRMILTWGDGNDDNLGDGCYRLDKRGFSEEV